jgi:hypothetical protein
MSPKTCRIGAPGAVPQDSHAGSSGRPLRPFFVPASLPKEEMEKSIILPFSLFLSFSFLFGWPVCAIHQLEDPGQDVVP